jgi:multiple antibiotic resistance protein
MGKTIGEAFGALFPVVAPVPMAPVFVALTADASPSQRTKVALRATLLTFVLLLIFLFAGEPLLHAFGISLEALQIAGGIVVALAGYQMTRDPVRVDADEHAGDIAFSPLTMPCSQGRGRSAS